MRQRRIGVLSPPINDDSDGSLVNIPSDAFYDLRGFSEPIPSVEWPNLRYGMATHSMMPIPKIPVVVENIGVEIKTAPIRLRGSLRRWLMKFKRPRSIKQWGIGYITPPPRI